jgi:hypothetical protein
MVRKCTSGSFAITPAVLLALKARSEGENAESVAREGWTETITSLDAYAMRATIVKLNCQSIFSKSISPHIAAQGESWVRIAGHRASRTSFANSGNLSGRVPLHGDDGEGEWMEGGRERGGREEEWQTK